MQTEQIVLTYKVLQSIKATAKQLDVSEYTVRRALYLCGVVPLPDGGIKAREMHEKGAQIEDICAAVGHGRSWVYLMLPDAGKPYATWDKDEEADVLNGASVESRSANAVRIKKHRLNRRRDE